MQLENVVNHLSQIIENQVNAETRNWLEDKIKVITDSQSTKDLYLTYSLISTKIQSKGPVAVPSTTSGVFVYLQTQKATVQQVTRIYLLVRVLKEDNEFFTPKVSNIIQVADTAELETFLKFLILLPNPENYKTVAVEALRTNIAVIFNAIAYNNPYPSLFFDDQQWNQMYLKTAFMEGDLSAIVDIDKKANKDLARIISDYAHERWSASRDIDPYFWRPVYKFLDSTLLADMKRLLNSDNSEENKAAALCCFNSDTPEAKKLLEDHQELITQIENQKISWKKLKEKA